MPRHEIYLASFAVIAAVAQRCGDASQSANRKWTANELQDVEDRSLLQVARERTDGGVADACSTPTPWPCGDETVNGYPLQQYNTEKDNCAAGQANIAKLDLRDGSYTVLCYIPGVCLNACATDPVDYQIYCQANGPAEFVRVSCPVTDLQSAVEGSLCYYGPMEGTYAAAFNNDTFNYIYKSNGGRIIEIPRTSILSFSGSTSRSSSTQVEDNSNLLTTVSELNSIADFVITRTDFGFGSDVYLIACAASTVRTLAFSDYTYRSFSMKGVFPEGASGAQWLYVDGSFSDVYCAYNNGNDGVIGINISETSDGLIPAGSVSRSLKTSSNDGLNCANAKSPFPPAVTTTTTTTTSLSTSTTPDHRLVTTTAGGGQGDPHIHTLDGRHFLLLRQGTFLQWRLRKPKEKPEVDWQLYAHYSGRASRTHGLMLMDKSSRVIEWTTQDCEWRTQSDGQWILLDPKSLQGEDPSGINASRLYSIGANRRYELDLYARTKQGARSFAMLHVRCVPGRRIDTKISMYNEDDISFVEGEIGPQKAASLNQQAEGTEQNDKFLSTATWPALGGSNLASLYLQQVDKDVAMLLTTCSDAEKAEAARLCAKHLGAHMENATGYHGQVFADCVFDVCNGGGEMDAELTAEILNA